MYESINLIANYVQYLIAIAVPALILRAMYIIHSMSNSFRESVSKNEILEKIGVYIKASIICVCVVAIIELIQKYFFHF